MKKGFTLIELLAVIVILSVITLITIPMITNVIEESKKKALASSVQGILDSTNYFTMSHETGVYEFLFDEEHQGSTINGEKLEYRGTIDGEGKLYIDKEGNTSICISNNNYYVYKNYNSGIIVGERKAGNCIIGFDALTNKYVAMLDNGTGNVSNVYSKDEVDNLVGNLQDQINVINTNMENLSSILKENSEKINVLSRNEINFDYSSNSEVTSTSEALQAMWDRLFPKAINFINTDEVSNWNATGQTYNSKKISDENRLYLSTADTGTYSDATIKSLVYTRNAIDLTYYKTLRIIGTASGFGSTSQAVPINIQLISESGVTTTLYSASYTGGSLSVNITKDISALQGKYTLRVTLSKYGNWHTYYNFTTFQIY